MGVIVGLILGAGLLLVWLSFFPAPPRAPSRRATTIHDSLTLAGWHGVGSGSFVALSIGLGLLVAATVLLISGAVTLAVAFGGGASFLPWMVVRARARSRRTVLRTLWPDAIDDLLSSVRAGMSLPEALGALAERGPEPMREQFAEFAADYRVSARFDESLDRLKDRFADPVADRIVEALRLTREVGGTDLGKTLRALAAMLREDQRTRGELEARQSWTVNAARLAVAAPWLVLGLLTFRAEAAAAYNTPRGALVLAAGALASGIAYVLMLRIGALPEERRIFR